MSFGQNVPVINMYGWHEKGLITMENVTVIHLSIVLDIVWGEFIQNYLKIFSF